MPRPDPAPHTCPRCLGGVPNEEMRGQYPGAQSRTDNLTEVCSNCGTMEAIEQMGGVLRHQGEWPLAGGPTRSLQDILNDPEDLGYADPDGMDLPPFEPGVDDLGDGRFRIRRGYERPPPTGEELDRINYPGYDLNMEGPDYSQPDPFDTSDPEQAAQAENIEETEQLFSQWDEERDRRRRGL